MVDRVTDGLKKTELETVSTLDADAQVGKDKEALVRAVDILEVVEARDARAARVSRLSVVEQMQLLVRVRVAQHGIHEVIGILQIPGLVLPAIAEGGGDGHSTPDAWRLGKLGAMTGPPLDGGRDRSAVDRVILAYGSIVGDDAELYDGSWVDGTSVGLFANTAHARLLGLFSNGQLVLDVIAAGGHLLNGDVLVGDAILRGAAWRRTRAAVVGLGHGGAVVLGRYRAGATVETAHF